MFIPTKAYIEDKSFSESGKKEGRQPDKLSAVNGDRQKPADALALCYRLAAAHSLIFA
jgi:hypothetical protein